ncbi:MAG: MarR family transcriptional regulator [Porticoccaceae bacterium]|nr:MarR family transcriptional regulator [Porticoccaceae bacterium]
MLTIESSGAEIHSKLFFRLYQTMNLSLRRTAEVLVEYEMSAQQWSILTTLNQSRHQEGLTVNALVDYLLVSRQSLNGVLKRMEESAYIKRMINPEDLRSRHICITAYGKEVCKKVAPQVSKFHSDSFQHISEEDKINSLQLLTKVMGNIR